MSTARPLEGKRILLTRAVEQARDLMARLEQKRFFIRAVHLDAVGLNVRIVFQRLMHNAPVKGVHWFQFHHVAPTANFIGGIFRLFHERLASLRAIAADIYHDFR